MEPNTNSLQHLDVFLKNIEKHTPFCFIRPNDGEYLIMNNRSFGTQDAWHYSGNGTLTNDLKNAIFKMIGLKNAFVGIPCKACWDGVYQWYMTTFNIPVEKLTYGNICCNRNWKPFTSVFINQKLPFYYIGPYKSNHYNLNVLDVFKVDEFLIHDWDSKKEKVITELTQWVSNKSGVFIFSAGPLTKVFIPILFEMYPHNTFMDVGSAFDLYMKGQTNRLYITSNDTYGNVVCDFNKGHV